jgi:hypothetical protein
MNIASFKIQANAIGDAIKAENPDSSDLVDEFIDAVVKDRQITEILERIGDFTEELKKDSKELKLWVGLLHLVTFVR